MERAGDREGRCRLGQEKCPACTQERRRLLSPIVIGLCMPDGMPKCFVCLFVCVCVGGV